MSLILDALRKADSERERGAVPGLRAQPLTPPSLEPRRRVVRPIVWIVAGLALVASVAFFAFRATRPLVAPVPVALPGQPVAPTVSPQTASAPIAAPTSAAPAGLASAPPAAVVTPPPIVAEVPAAKPAPWSPMSVGDSHEAVKSESASTRPPPKEPVAQPEAKVPSRPIASAEAPILTRAQLPDSLRAQLPPLVIGGSIYSSNAANRSVIINGQVWRENDAVMPDLVLEQIKPKAAVFRFKGTRFEQPL